MLPASPVFCWYGFGWVKASVAVAWLSALLEIIQAGIQSDSVSLHLKYFVDHRWKILNPIRPTLKSPRRRSRVKAGLKHTAWSYQLTAPLNKACSWRSHGRNEDNCKKSSLRIISSIKWLIYRLMGRMIRKSITKVCMSNRWYVLD